jgi:hypothetical protein
MKTIHITIFVLFFSNLYSQDLPEKKISTEVSEVTVFLDGAQITRKKNISLTKGEFVLKFTDLSPFIEPKSLQVKAEGEIRVLSVNHQQDYLGELEKSAELKELESEMESIDREIEKENTYLSIIAEEIAFLRENRDIGGKDAAVSVSSLQQASEFYGSKLTDLKMKEIERRQNLKKLNKERSDLNRQINSLSSKNEFPAGEILVKLEAEKQGNFDFELSYLVANAGWFPSYDVRAANITEPVQLIYKANVKQDTKVDWKDVRLTFSTSQPSVSGVAPELITYYLDYNTRPPDYQRKINSVSGVVMGMNREALPGASVVVEGTTIGTVADAEGRYSITIPDRSVQLSYSYIGYQTKTLPVSGSSMNVILQEDVVALEEVVVVAHGSRRKSEVSEALQGRVAGVAMDDEIKIRGVSGLTLDVSQVERQTSVSFEIERPYTVKSDNKNYMVDMKVYQVPAYYQYYSVPRVEEEAYLIAGLTDWEQYNLLAGEANVFFEDSYVGKTLLNVGQASDTLEISLGRDKQVSVKREKVKDFTTRQFIGNKKEETRGWNITVRNNKNQEIDMIVLDQVPVSTREEIEVELKNHSGAKFDSETGKLKWSFDLKPGKTEEMELRYSVKYPKNRNLIIE